MRHADYESKYERFEELSPEKAPIRCVVCGSTFCGLCPDGYYYCKEHMLTTFGQVVGIETTNLTF